MEALSVVATWISALALIGTVIALRRLSSRWAPYIVRSVTILADAFGMSKVRVARGVLALPLFLLSIYALISWEAVERILGGWGLLASTDAEREFTVAYLIGATLLVVVQGALLLVVMPSGRPRWLVIEPLRGLPAEAVEDWVVANDLEWHARNRAWRAKRKRKRAP